MKNIGLVLFLGSFFLLGSKSDESLKGMVPEKNMLHIGIVVKDINASIDHWTQFLGVDTKPNISIAAGNPDNPTQYKGKPSEAQAKLAFFHLDNIQVELIEPIGDTPSSWREFLETKGEGVHHIGFSVKGLGEQYIDIFGNDGMPMVQHGGWNGGEYGYMDSADKLGVIVELLEFYNK